MTARLAALAVLAALPLVGTAPQVVAPIAIYIDAPRSSLVGPDYAVTVDEMRVPVTAVSRGPQPLSAIVLLDVSDSLRLGPVVELGKLSGVARPGDTLLLCSSGLAAPLRGEKRLAELLTERWSGRPAPGLAGFLMDTQVRVKGYADDRTAAAVWEA